MAEDSDEQYGETPDNGDDNQKLAKMLEQWSEMENLLEASGRNEKLDTLLIEYITHLKNDNVQVQFFRNTVIVLAIILIGSLWFCLYNFITGNWMFFGFIGSNARVAFIVGLFALTGAFVTVVLQGAYRKAKERHQDGLPNNVSVILKALMPDRD